MKKILVFVLGLFISVTVMAQKPAVMLSEKPGWHKIAVNHVSYKTDADSVFVMWNDHFKAIKLKAKDASVNLKSFDVVYENGSNQSIPFKVGVLKAGAETDVTNLVAASPIRKIVLVYNTIPGTGVEDKHKGDKKERAEVEIWGLK